MIAITVLAIPIFFTLMALELVYESYTEKRTYRLNDAITNISTGTLQQATGVFFKVINVGIYALLFEYVAFYHLPNNWITFCLVFVLYDLAYYWVHRFAHTVSLFWGGHVVHHQSEDYNLSVALRQTSTGFIWGFPFYLPIALMGFSPEQFLLVGGLNLLYQFWIHTEHIDKMPRWFEYVFNTPSHHRVHHGRNPKYIDKNYAGVFIAWDRVFGTFKGEEERPTYGITTPLKSWNPVYANFAHYIDLFHLTKKSKSTKDTLGILFNKPGWMPSYLGGYQAPTKPTSDYIKYDIQSRSTLSIYIVSQFLLLLLVVPIFFFVEKDLSLYTNLAYVWWIVLTTLSFGFLFEKKKNWLSIFEVVRFIYLILLTNIVTKELGLIHVNYITWTAVLISVLSISFFWYIRKEG